ncbi:hybrid sensor histidine kinase/response regulator [Desulfatitalea alkaliphila]|uniref:histidine kinase n=1 Tax=Desulfatitalea alkaliphila TaxID=2929485 RepID=A0AA41R6R6_9BACT|nr:PAS domain S-box protein [Desulfatitalea alkaliphila]MCJ8500123.1 PAS domain S-box protein [Desulfatitalea alkaliphila]
MDVASQPNSKVLERRIAELQRENELLQNALTLRKLAIEAAEFGIWDYNPMTGATSFCPRWKSMLGFENDERPSTYVTIRELLHPEDDRQVSCVIDDFLKNPEELLSLKCRFRSKNGDWRWIQSKGKVSAKEADGNISRIVGVYFDITERQMLEIDLRTTRFSFDNASIGIYRIASDARIIEINRQAAMNLGYTIEEMRNMSLFDIDPNITSEEWKALWQALLRQGADSFERSHLRKDGTEMPVEITSQLLEYDGQQFAISFVMDISGRKAAETEKEKLQKQLLQSQKMESIGHLAGGIAHDFNNTLSVIVGNSELAMRNPTVDKVAQRHLEQILSAAFRSSELVKQLLAFARKQTIKPIVLDINDTISEMLNMLHRLIGENIELTWLPCKEACRVMLDPSQIDQILANLVVNAKDAIDGGGTITIETERVEVKGTYREQRLWLKPGNYIMLSVSDNGCGMDKETQQRIFDPFFSTKAVGRGTGLGLATVYGIVKQNNGFLSVYSEINHGTSFKIYIPATEMPLRAIESGSELEKPSNGGETVLVVEDDAGILEFVEAILGEFGYTVVTAKTPHQAINRALAMAPSIDLVLTDVVMPMMNGRELSKRLEEIIPGIKCLYMSGYTANVIAHHGVLDEGVNFISKPFAGNDLARKVRQALDA